ncbi:MAG: S41 family peptidase [Bacteroidetes bacterium]|jgi:hypothetical protein|nr:S41 family peptidase [Bacteroidota bacterium]
MRLFILSIQRGSSGCKRNSSHFANSHILVKLFGSAALAVLFTTIFGCSSSQSLLSLAKSPPDSVQQRQGFQSLNKYQQDLLYFSSQLQQTHPEPYRYVSKEWLDSETDRLLNVFAHETSDVSFQIGLEKLASHVHDSHTQVRVGDFSDKRVYPIGILWLKDSLYVAAVEEGGDSTLVGSTVIALNGVPLSSVCGKLASYFSYDNFGWVRWKLIQPLRSPWYLKHEGIITSDTLLLTLNSPRSGQRAVSLLPVLSPSLKYTYKSSEVTGRKKELYWYTIIPADSLCYMQFNTMFDRHLLSAFGFFQRIPLYFIFVTKGIGYFDSYVDKMLEEMHKRGVRTLVVDLRGNGGGSSILGDQLLYKLGVADSIRGFSTLVKISPLLRAVYPERVKEYERRFRERTGRIFLPDTLINTDSLYVGDSTASDYFAGIEDKHSDYYTKPAKYPFKGQVYFITGEGTFSSASVLAATVKDNKLFTIVGQPTGQASHYGEVLILRLPNTGTYCTISCKKFLRPDRSLDNECAVLPDKEIWLSFDEFENGVDPVYNWILRRVDRGKRK